MVQVKVCKTLDVGSIPTANSENFHHSSDICGTVFDRKKEILGVVQLVERLTVNQDALMESQVQVLPEELSFICDSYSN